MPFPKPGSKFPPEDFREYYNRMLEWEAWYSGDPQRLLNLYSSSLYFPNTDLGRFWARMEAEERSGCVHLPVAGDVASTSANLLFSEVPEFAYNQDAPGGDRITDFIKENGFFNVLLEAAEMAAAMSGVFLKLDIEPDLLKLPIVSIVTPLQALPYFWRGRLWEVLFFRTVREDSDGKRWRLFELRSRQGSHLLIQYKLFRGTIDNVGIEADLQSIDETATLGLEDVAYEMPGLGCVYVPNMRPNRLMLGSPLGINDYSGVITLMDSLDFTWTSWMRDIELGMAQLLIDEDLLSRGPEGGIVNQDTSSPRFNKFQKAFVKLNLAPWRLGGENVRPIEQVQFDIRVEAHFRTCESLFFQIVTQCGYSPQTFGLITFGAQAGSGSPSGYALKIRERRSQLTREKKSRYWQPAIRELLMQMQMLDLSGNLAPSSYQVQELDVELQDSIITDDRERSETIRNLDQARAISTWAKVKMLHPEWNDADIEEEVQKILNEQAMNPPPFGEVEEEEGIEEGNA